MKRRIVITIDGLAGSGKTTIARELAKKLKFKYLSTGLIYRAVGYLAISKNINFADEASLADEIDRAEIKLLDVCGNNHIFLNKKDITDLVAAPEISEAASETSRHSLVRKKLLDMQRKAFPRENLLAEGRDMGTVVFPEADLKFFIQCAPEVLAERRLRQLYAEGIISAKTTEKQLKKQLAIEIKERNQRDTERSNSPVVPAADAIVIDNSSKPLTELLNFVYSQAFARFGDDASL